MHGENRAGMEMPFMSTVSAGRGEGVDIVKCLRGRISLYSPNFEFARTRNFRPISCIV